jgi:hypothetical protein
MSLVKKKLLLVKIKIEYIASFSTDHCPILGSWRNIQVLVVPLIVMLHSTAYPTLSNQIKSNMYVNQCIQWNQYHDELVLITEAKIKIKRKHIYHYHGTQKLVLLDRCWESIGMWKACCLLHSLWIPGEMNMCMTQSIIKSNSKIKFNYWHQIN